VQVVRRCFFLEVSRARLHSGGHLKLAAEVCIPEPSAADAWLRALASLDFLLAEGD
jgi:hypothetical protein